MKLSQRVDRALQWLLDTYRGCPAIPRDLAATAFFLVAAYGASRILIDHTGGENNSALVFKPIVKDGKTLGAIGVLGPRRMDYARVLATLEGLSDNIEDIIRAGKQPRNEGEKPDG